MKWILLALLINSAQAKTTTNTEFTYYNVFIRYLKDINNELGRYSGSKWQGTTWWWIKWSYQLSENKGICSAKNINTTINIKYKMPKLYPTYREKAVKVVFDNYYKKLMTHEKGHSNHGLTAGKKIDEMIGKAENKNCDILTKEINNKAKKIISLYQIKDKEYDKKTSHGLNQS